MVFDSGYGEFCFLQMHEVAGELSVCSAQMLKWRREIFICCLGENQVIFDSVHSVKISVKSTLRDEMASLIMKWYAVAS
jgi:hypothetical protein